MASTSCWCRCRYNNPVPQPTSVGGNISGVAGISQLGTVTPGGTGFPRNAPTTGVSGTGQAGLIFPRLTGVAATGAAASIAAFPALKLALPLYITSGSSYWSQVAIDSPPITGYVVMNSNNGPGSSYDGTYAAHIAAVQASGLMVLGYVYTQGPTYRTAVSVEADIATYMSWYNVNGIFIDECSGLTADISYYQGIVAYVKAQTGTFCVLNPGSVPSDLTYMSMADSVGVFEGTYSTFTAWTPPSWVATTPPNQLTYLVYDCTTEANMVNAVSLALSWNAGYFYVTDDTTPDPYDTIASYWTAELSQFFPPIIPITGVFGTGQAGTPVAQISSTFAGVAGSGQAGTATPNASGGGVTVSLYSDSSGTPNALIAVLGTIADTVLGVGTSGPIRLPLATPIQLTANTRYWIRLTDNGGTTLKWVPAGNSVGTGVSTEFWHTPSTSGANISTFAYQMTVTSEEPSGVAGVGQVGTQIASVAAVISGASGLGQCGTTSIQSGTSDSAAVTGVAGTGTIGSPSDQVGGQFSGGAGSGQAGGLVPSLSLTLAGVSASGQVGSAVSSVAAAASGVTATGQAGSAADQDAGTLLGASGTGTCGWYHCPSGGSGCRNCRDWPSRFCCRSGRRHTTWRLWHRHRRWTDLADHHLRNRRRRSRPSRRANHSR